MHVCMLKDTTESQTAQQIKTMTQKCNKKNLCYYKIVRTLCKFIAVYSDQYYIY